MNGEVSHERARRLQRGTLATLLLVACYSGCDPDLDQLSSEYGSATGGSSNASGGAIGSGGSARGGANSGGTSSPGAGHAGMTSTGGGTSAGGRGASASGGSGTQAGGVGGEAGGAAGMSGAGGAGGAGGVMCDPGFVSCPGAPECSTDLRVGNAAASASTVTDCGACGVTCSAENASKASCAAGVCSPTCMPGFFDCNASTKNDGCETPSSASNCGKCGRVCSNSGASSVTCDSGGTCTPTCAPKYADCNVDTGTGTDDGCEVYLDELTQCGTTCTNGGACAASQVCNSGACGAPQGVVVLKVPLTATKQTQRYIDSYSMQVNLLGSFMVVRAYAPGAKAGRLGIFSSDADFTAGGGISVDLSELASGWKDIKMNLGGALGAAFDPSVVRQVTIEVSSGPSGPWTNPTVVYIDGIRTTNDAVNETFDSSLGSMVKSDSPAVAGSTVSWLNALP